ncbi:hypothetical protein WLH_03023 [Escherichia coli O25b:H4]|uniref:Uncharacterized protein n=1 Tax=Escherichia coli O25b:H4 TaxID=941280 RepID=A0A192CFI3_ECO25|nr:hypothetical protein WLH_03023 [Escherichia coli O25b:H4]
MTYFLLTKKSHVILLIQKSERGVKCNQLYQ